MAFSIRSAGIKLVSAINCFVSYTLDFDYLRDRAGRHRWRLHKRGTARGTRTGGTAGWPSSDTKTHGQTSCPWHTKNPSRAREQAA